MRRATISFSLMAVAALLLGACGPAPTPEVIREEVQVEVEVTREVEVEVPLEVEVEVTREVEVEVEVPVDLVAVRINMGYIPDIQYTPFYVGLEKGYFAEEGLQLNLDYSTEVDGIELLAAGEAAFAVGSGDLAVQARSQGLPVKYVLRWYNGIPSAIVSLKESGIETPEDLVGKTVGIPGFFGINYKSYLAMLAANGLTADDVQLEAVGWTQIASVSEGVVDAAVVYSNNEPVQMAVGGTEVNVIELREWNSFVPIGIMSTDTYIAKNPEVVQGFARAFLRSLKATLDDPEFALEAGIRAVGIAPWDRAKAEASLAKAMEFWATDDGTYGYYEADTFEWTQDFLLSAGEMDNEIDVIEVFTNEFVENAQP